MAYSDATENAVTGGGNAQYGCWIGFQVDSIPFTVPLFNSLNSDCVSRVCFSGSRC